MEGGIKRNCDNCAGCPMFGKGCQKPSRRRRLAGTVVKWILLALAYGTIGLLGGAVGHFVTCDVIHPDENARTAE